MSADHSSDSAPRRSSRCTASGGSKPRSAAPSITEGRTPAANDPSTVVPVPPGKGEALPRLALRPRDAAAALGISERALWSLMKAGEIPHVRAGRSVLYPVDSLRKWLADRAEGGDR